MTNSPHDSRVCRSCGGAFSRPSGLNLKRWARFVSCSLECRRAWEGSTARFLERVSPEPNTGCWLWLGGTFSGSGYGRYSVKHRSRLAHRVSYMLFRGAIPASLDVCHHCDVKPCVNPQHLFLGTQTDNYRDAMAKGRVGVGSWHPSAKLTEEEVLMIRASHETSSVLAERFGVVQNTVRAIRRGDIWGYL